MMDKIFKQIRKGILLGICITVFGGVAFAIDLPSREGASEKMQILQNRLNQNIQGVALLQEKQSVFYRGLARPYSEYLLYQQDFGHQRYTADLERMRRERGAILQRLTFLKSAGSAQESPLSEMVGQMSPKRVEVYSGAPMLSFYNGSYLDAKAALKPSADRIRIFRVMSGALLAILFSFPLIALYKKMSEPDKRRMVQVFPIFTVRSSRRYGSRELLKARINGGKTAQV